MRMDSISIILLNYNSSSSDNTMPHIFQLALHNHEAVIIQ